MCGIFGYIGPKKVEDVLVKGLKNLEYRGYDSSGIALKNNDEIKIIKEVGKVKILEEEIKKSNLSKYDLGIAHTRWATHGGVTKVNSHPHFQGEITLVHNGIIENYNEIKEFLEKEKVTFISETDSEIAAGLINYYLKSNNILEALKKSLKKLKGSYAFLIILKNENKIYAVRKNSPLILGIRDNEKFLSSDIAAMLEYTNKYIEIDEEEIFEISNELLIIHKDNSIINKEIKEETMTVESMQKDGYDHFMLKEINEQIEIADKLLNVYLPNNEFSTQVLDLTKYKYIDIVACGSAYYAGLVGKHLMEKYMSDAIIKIDVASEYRYKTQHYKKDTLVILISQSGETADTIAAMNLAIENNIDTLAIVNNQLSTIAKTAKYKMPLLIGPEIAVATSKGYFSQVLLLSILVLNYLKTNNKLTNLDFENIINDFKSLKNNISNIIHNIDYKSIAKKIYENKDIYFIGRGIDYNIVLEASLKLKEISYIHSDAYQAGELKHGSIALIEEDTPLIALITEESLAEKTISNIIEAKARGAKVIIFKKNNIKVSEKDFSETININALSEFVTPLLAIVPFQMLAYHVALKLNCDIDKPKNLAKSVTVE